MILKNRYAPLVFGIVLVAVLGTVLFLFRSSPGELSAPHKAVAGSPFIGNCRKCHSEKGLAAGCLSCHSEIAAQLDGRKGYHGRVLGKKAGDCAACHSEHNGAEFKLINKVSWGGVSTGTFRAFHPELALKDSHLKLRCEDCHVKHAPVFSLPGFSGHKRGATFLGLDQNCSTCHDNPHSGGREADCAQCHTQDKFRPARNFDHTKYFPLTEGHAGLACTACHGPKTRQDKGDKLFGPVAGKTCRDCHQSPHKAPLGRDCRVCHTDRAVPWAKASGRMTKTQHQAAGFPLEKPHDRAACRDCHEQTGSYAERYLRPGLPRSRRDCAACHKDPHAGQFAGRDCLTCHEEGHFKPARYSAREHAAVYQLKGGHSKAACAACHVKDAALGGAVRYAKTRSDCAFCHKDPHAGQFRSGGKTVCETCHYDDSDWKKNRFDHNTMSRFKLNQAHSRVACRECHPEALTKSGGRVTLYKPLKSDCSDCHATPK